MEGHLTGAAAAPPQEIAGKDSTGKDAFVPNPEIRSGTTVISRC
jgi:hypothetical protein